MIDSISSPLLNAEKAKILFSLDKTKEANDLIIQELLKKPEKDEYWVLLHIITANTEPETSKKALFKAYELNPADLTVLNCLLSYYLKKGEQTKFYHTL